MHLRRRLLTFGVFLLVLGTVPLAVRTGVLDATAISGWWNLWPLLLVGTGVGLVLQRTSLDVLGGLLTAVILGLMGGAFLATGAGNLPTAVCGNDRATESVASEEGTFEEAATIDVQLDCGELEIAGVAGASWTFEAMGNPERPPAVAGSGSSLEIESGDSGLGIVSRREHWEIGIPLDVPTTLDVQLNAGRATIAPGPAALDDVDVQVNFGAVVLDLRTVTSIGELDLQSNAGSSALTLPSVSLTGRIQANAGSVHVCVPEGAAVRIETENSVVSSYDLDGSGLIQDGSTWTSPDYETAAVQIDLRAEANAGSFALNPEEGCDG